jgi:large subunit ribosomal protein L30
MGYFRITLLRSGIGLPKKIRGVLEAIGLRKRMAITFLPISRDSAGQIMKIKELVDVQEVEHAKTRQQLKAERRPDPGFYVETRSRDWMMDAGTGR